MGNSFGFMCVWVLTKSEYMKIDSVERSICEVNNDRRLCGLELCKLNDNEKSFEFFWLIRIRPLFFIFIKLLILAHHHDQHLVGGKFVVVFAQESITRNCLHFYGSLCVISFRIYFLSLFFFRFVFGSFDSFFSLRFISLWNFRKNIKLKLDNEDRPQLHTHAHHKLV